MDQLLKVWILLGSSVFLWLVPPAFKFNKLLAIVCFNGSIACLIVASNTSKKLVKIEQLITKQSLLEDDLLNSELAWQADQREEELKQRYLIEPQAEPATVEAQPNIREQFEANLAATDRLINELIQRSRTAAPPPPAEPPPAEPPLLSQGSQKLKVYAAKKGFMDIRTLAKNWGRHHDFNAKEVKSFCDELVKANLAEWSGDQWRLLGN